MKTQQVPLSARFALSVSTAPPRRQCLRGRAWHARMIHIHLPGVLASILELFFVSARTNKRHHHHQVLLQPRIPADARPRYVYSVQSWLLRQSAKSVRVLPVRGGVQLYCYGCHRQRNMHAALWLFFGCEQCRLRCMSCKVEFTSRVSSHHRLHLQCWSNIGLERGRSSRRPQAAVRAGNGRLCDCTSKWQRELSVMFGSLSQPRRGPAIQPCAGTYTWHREQQ
jgi:hypothetical protein